MKLTLISARPDEVAEDVSSLLGVEPEEIIRISAKNGINVASVARSDC